MKSNLVISIILILCAISCDKMDVSESQSHSFIKFHSNYPVFTAADVRQVTGSGFAILGTAKTNNDGTQLCLIRTNEYGNTIDSARFYGRALDDQAYCLQVMADGGFAILGSSRNPLNEKLEVFFIRTDNVGDILWSRTIGATGNVEAKHFEVNDQGSFIMTGYAEVETVKQIWIGALDNDGNQPYWSPKIRPSTKDAEGRHLQILDDGGFAITGFSKNDPSDLLLYNHAFILKTNSSGQISDIYFAPSSADEEGNCLRTSDSDHFMILGTKKNSTGTDISLKYLSLSERQVKWEKTFGSSGNDIGQCLLTDGNSIYILGTNSTSGINTAISFITTDALGNKLDSLNFGLGSQLSASSFEQTNDGGFIILGTNKYSENSISVALIKIGADGAL